MTQPKAIETSGDQLRQSLAERLRTLSDDQLQLINRVVLQLEAEQAAEAFMQGLSEDWRSGKLTEESIRQAIAEHRTSHPYR